jgi:molybdenum cofactor synthesis domain-containing protein
MYGGMMYTLGILTASDTGAAGKRQDLSGMAIAEILCASGFEKMRYAMVPDERDVIAAYLRKWSDEDGLDLILTTGGTGLSPRDVTPEATLDVIDREVPGLSEAIRAETSRKNLMAIISRGRSGIRGKTLIVNLPGSEKAVRECLEAIKPVLPHAIDILTGKASQQHPAASGRHGG